VGEQIVLRLFAMLEDESRVPEVVAALERSTVEQLLCPRPPRLVARMDGRPVDVRPRFAVGLVRLEDRLHLSVAGEVALKEIGAVPHQVRRDLLAGPCPHQRQLRRSQAGLCQSEQRPVAVHGEPPAALLARLIRHAQLQPVLRRGAAHRRVHQRGIGDADARHRACPDLKAGRPRDPPFPSLRAAGGAQLQEHQSAEERQARTAAGVRPPG